MLGKLGQTFGRLGASSGSSLGWIPNPTNKPDIAINWSSNKAWTKTGGLTTPAALGITTSRASVKQVVDGSGNWSEVAANVTAMSNLGRSTEEARTNSIRNNTMQGAVAGTPGTLPTNWGSSILGGITQTLGTPTVVNGVDVLPITLSGTAATTGSYSYIIENTAAALNAQVWTGSLFVQIVSGTVPRLAKIEIDELDSGGGFLAGTVTAITPTTSFARYDTNRTNTNASTAKERVQFQITATAGDVVNVTFYLGWPQLELGASVTSPIKTTSGAATRAADVTTLTGLTFGAAYSMFSQATPQAPLSYSAAQTLLQLDNGTSSQRTVMRRSVAGAVLIAAVGGTGTSLIPAGSLSQNAQVKLASSWAAGAQAGCSNGGTVATSAVASLPTTPTELSFGENVGSEQLNGLAAIDAIWLTQAVPSAQLVTMTT